MEYSNDFWNSKHIPAEDPSFVERKPIKGFSVGDFVSFKDHGVERYGIIDSAENNGKPDMVTFTTSTGEDTGFGDLAIKFEGTYKKIVPRIMGLRVRVKSCPKDEILAFISEDENKNVILVSDSQNELMDDIPFDKWKYSAVLLTEKEREEMNRVCFGRVNSALAFIKTKNFGYRFIVDRKKKGEKK